MLASYVPAEPGNAGMPNDIEPRKRMIPASYALSGSLQDLINIKVSKK